MAGPLPHNNLITQAGREILRPLGLMQKGRSRLWIDDHGWWIINVEFQPSQWSRGSQLNVGAQWLWRFSPGSCFEYSYRELPRDVPRPPGYKYFFEYENDEQFLAAARTLAGRAALGVKTLRELLGNIDSLPIRIVEHTTLLNRTPAYHVAIALALSGRVEAARPYMDLAIVRDPKYESSMRRNREVAAAAPLLDDLPALRRHLIAAIQEERVTLRLPEREIILPGSTPR